MALSAALLIAVAVVLDTKVVAVWILLVVVPTRHGQDALHKQPVAALTALEQPMALANQLNAVAAPTVPARVLTLVLERIQSA